MDHNRTSLGSTIDGELKLATQLPKGFMILVDKENFQKNVIYSSEKWIKRQFSLIIRPHFFKVFKLDHTGLHWILI